MGLQIRSLVFGCLILTGSTVWADPSISLLKQARSSGSFDRLAKSLMSAMHFGTYRGISRAKLPGPFRYHLESGFTGMDVKDEDLAVISAPNSSAQQTAPDSYSSVYVKGGASFPFGFTTELGYGRIISGYGVGAMFANVSYQAFDFDNVIYTDMVPAVSISTGGSYMLEGPGMWSWTSQVNIGGYHRVWLAQLNYFAQLSFVQLTALSPATSTWMLHHGITSLWPVWEGLNVVTEVAIQPLIVSAALNYLF